MLQRFKTGLAFAATLLMLASTHAMAGERVDNFLLYDHNGAAWELYYYKDAPAVVMMVHGNGCPIVRGALPAFDKLREEFEDDGVQFVMINSNIQDHRESIQAEAADYGIGVPVLEDTTQLIGESLDLVRTGEILVISPKTWEVVYRGPIDDRQDYGREKAEANTHYVADAVRTTLAGEAVEVAQRDAVGCLINFPGRDQKEQHAQISYSETIAPMLAENCGSCHRPGGIGPWAMTEYVMVQGFAPMIREVIRTKRMPPWFADPEIGTWAHDKSLSIEQRQQLVHWIEAGAPRGDGEDPLKTLITPIDNEWQLGEPDMVVEIPAFDIPASGVVEYKFPVVKNEIGRDVWVRAAEVMAGDSKVVHHILVGTGVPSDDDRESVFDNYLVGYAPGAEYQIMPEGTGVFIPEGDSFLFQLHYTPAGKATTDVSKLALYFYDEPPANFLRHEVALNPTINIPANADRHEETAYFAFHRDADLHQILPHSHYRGRSSTFTLIHPDGEEELLLSVPAYDFNWQRGYEFAKPLRVKAGSRLVHSTIYDNSARNPGNPNPERAVPWGLQSHDEMLYGDILFSWVEETSDKPIHDRNRMDITQLYGFADRDMDGKLVLEEMPKWMMRRIGGERGMKAGDRNQDGGLSVDEFLMLMLMAQARQRQQQGGAVGGGQR